MSDKQYPPGSPDARTFYNTGYADGEWVPAMRYKAPETYKIYTEDYWLAQGWADQKAGRPRSTDGWATPPPAYPPPPASPGTVRTSAPPPRPPGTPPPVVVRPPIAGPPVTSPPIVGSPPPVLGGPPPTWPPTPTGMGGDIPIRVVGPDGKVYAVPPGTAIPPGFYPYPGGYPPTPYPSTPYPPWHSYPPYPPGYYPPDPWERGLTYCGDGFCIKIRDPKGSRWP